MGPFAVSGRGWGGGEKGQGRWTPRGWHLGRIRQGQGRSLGRLPCGLVTHTGASRESLDQVGPEPADTPGSGWAEAAAAPPGHRAWEVRLRGAPGPGGQAPRGLAAASDLRVLEESWAGCEASGRGLPAGPSTWVLPCLSPGTPNLGHFACGCCCVRGTGRVLGCTWQGQGRVRHRGGL